MILNEQQRKEFEEVTRPVMKWLNDNCHPHVSVVVAPTSAELSEGVVAVRTNDYIHD